jgi:lipopolysaccharide export system protein LptA
VARAQVETHSKAPIDIPADEAEVVNAKCEAVWRGSAEAIQDKTRLRADVITIHSHPKGTSSDGQPVCGGADRIEADGHVYYATPDQNAKGDKAVYTQADDVIVVTGDVVLVQGKDVARGSKLTIHVGTRQAVMESAATGTGAPGRVRAVFYPDKSDTGDSSAAAPVAGPVRP